MTSDISHQASTVLSKLVTVHVLSASTTRQAQRRRRKWLTFSINEQDLTSLSRDRVKSSLSTALIVTIKLTRAKKIRTKANTKASQVDLVRDTTNHKNLLSVDQQSTVWAALMCECVSIQHRTVVTILLFSSVDRYCSNVDRWRRTADVQRGVQSSSQWSVVSGHHGLSSEWSVVSVFCPVSGQWSVVSGHCVLSSQWSVVSVSCPVSGQWSVVSGHCVLSSEWSVVSGQWSVVTVTGAVSGQWSVVSGHYVLCRLGAVKMAMVAPTRYSEKIQKHRRSTTIAANFQSLVSSSLSMSSLIFLVM